MADEAPVAPTTPTDAAPPVTTPVAPPPSTEPASFDFTKHIGADGKLLDGWKNGLPENLRHEMVLDTTLTVPDAFSQLINAQKMIGKNKVVLPTDKSTPQEWEAFHTALGRPKTPDEYKLAIPAGQEALYPAETLSQAKQLFHKAGFNQKQVDALWAFDQQRLADAEKQLQQQEEQEYLAAEKAIVEESGEALEQQKHLANKLIADEVPDQGKREKLLEALNDNKLRPYVFNFLAQIQAKYREQHSGIPASNSPNVMTPGQMEAKAQELMATPGYLDGTMKNSNPAGYERLTREISDLYNRAEKK
jgi:hypothetical protein